MLIKKSTLCMFSVLVIILLVSSTASANSLNPALGTGLIYRGNLTNRSAPAADQRGLSFPQNSVFGNGVNADETYFYEDFESYLEYSYPSSFTQIYNGCGDAEQKVITTVGYDEADSKVFRLLGCNSWASEQYVSLPSPLPAILVVDAYVKPVSGSFPGGLRLRHPSGTWGTEISSVIFNSGGNITAGDIVIGSYTAGTWYHVVMVHNIAQYKYAVYLNDIKLADDLNMFATLSPTQLELLGGNTGSNEIYYDNVGIYGDLLDLSPCTPPPSGMVSWWGGDNNALDMVGGNNGTLMGNTTFASGVVGEAFRFDGAETNFVEIPDSAELNPSGAFSVDGWFYIDPTAAGNVSDIATLVAKSEGSNGNGWSLYFDDRWSTKSLKFVLGSVVEAVSAISTANWYHITGVYNPSATPRASLYLNGENIADSGLWTGTVSSNSLNVRIGAMYWTDSYHQGNDRLNGKADEVEFFNRALSAAEVSAIFNAGSAGKCRSCTPAPANMVSWWGGDNNALDMVGTNNGTLMGNATYAAGMVGQAFSLDGAEASFVEIPNKAELNPSGAFSVDGWFYIDPLDNAKTISCLVSKWDAGYAPGWGLDLSGSDLRMSVRSSAGVHAGAGLSGAVPSAAWYHVAGVFDPLTTPRVKLYVNGLHVASCTVFVDDVGSNSFDVRIGACNWTEIYGVGNDRLNGKADEVEFFNRALSATEIAAIYNAGSAGSCKLDTIPPTVVSVIRANPNPTNAANVDFTVTFSENVTGVDTADFALTKTGTIADESVSTVTGGPTVYSVTVNTGSGDGTLRLDVLDDDTIQDPALNSLGGAGISNGDFTTGETYEIDKTAPTVTMSSLSSDPTDASPIAVTVQFSETVTGFTSDDILTSNGAVSNFVAEDGDTYTFDLTPSAEGLVTADIASGVATDLADNGNTMATQFSRTYAPIYNLFVPLIQR